MSKNDDESENRCRKVSYCDLEKAEKIPETDD